MKDKVFIGWSGGKAIAKKVQAELEKIKYKCIIGGNDANDSDHSSVGDTVIGQMNDCNQAIMIFGNKADGNISDNLFFELGYVYARYGAKKVHCVRKGSENILLPTDFDNAFVEKLGCETDDKFVENIIAYFSDRQKMSIDTNKMMLINNRYRIHDLIQSHYSKSGSKCSDYELAQYMLFYMQAAHMFGDESKVEKEIREFKQQHSFDFSTELKLSVNLLLEFFELLTSIRKSSAGDICISAAAYRKFSSACDDFMYAVREDDISDTFDEWFRVFVTEHLTYSQMMFAASDDLDDEMRLAMYSKCKKTAMLSLDYIDILEKSTPCKENNDSIGLVSLFKSYIYRNIYMCCKYLGEPEELDWLERSRREKIVAR